MFGQREFAREKEEKVPMWRKLCVLLCVVVLGLGTLAGCSPTSGDNIPPSTTGAGN